MSGGSQIFFGAATPACWTVGGRLGRSNCQSFPYLENVGDDDCHCFVLQLHYLRGEVGGRGPALLLGFRDDEICTQGE